MLHRVCNGQGELFKLTITAGNVDDRRPVPNLFRDLFDKLLNHREYISQKLMQQLRQDQDLNFITRLRKNMQNRLMLASDKLLLRKRAMTESMFGSFRKNSQIEPSRHRSLVNYFVNLPCGLIADGQ